MINLKQIFDGIDDLEIKQGIDLTNFSTMKLKSTGNLITVKSVDALKIILPILSKNKIKYLMLGLGANQVFPENCDFVFLKLDFVFDNEILKTVKERYVLPASLTLNKLTSHAIRFGIKGWEVFTGIPATLGGAVFMNAGTGLGEIGSVVKQVGVVTNQGLEKTYRTDSHSFSYRKNNFLNPGEVIIWIELGNFGIDPEISNKIKSYLTYRNVSQPLTAKTCGCIFKNHSKTCRAGHYLDILGMKGFSVGDIEISTLHSNFFENIGLGTRAELEEIITIAKKEIKLYFGIDLDVEIKFV